MSSPFGNEKMNSNVPIRQPPSVRPPPGYTWVYLEKWQSWAAVDLDTVLALKFMETNLNRVDSAAATNVLDSQEARMEPAAAAATQKLPQPHPVFDSPPKTVIKLQPAATAAPQPGLSKAMQHTHHRVGAQTSGSKSAARGSGLVPLPVPQTIVQKVVPQQSYAGENPYKPLRAGSEQYWETDRFGVTYIGLEDALVKGGYAAATTGVNKQSVKQYHEEHGFYETCVCCWLLNKSCDHAWAPKCGPCRLAGRNCKYIFARQRVEDCVRGLQCHDCHEDFIVFTLINGHDIEYENGEFEKEEMPALGSHLPWSEENKNGYPQDAPGPPPHILNLNLLDEFKFDAAKAPVLAYWKHRTEQPLNEGAPSADLSGGRMVVQGHAAMVERGGRDSGRGGREAQSPGRESHYQNTWMW